MYKRQGLELKEEEGKDYVTDFDFDSGKLGIAGYGFGIDLGASYKILDNLTAVSYTHLEKEFAAFSSFCLFLPSGLCRDGAV